MPFRTDPDARSVTTIKKTIKVELLDFKLTSQVIPYTRLLSRLEMSK